MQIYQYTDDLFCVEFQRHSIETPSMVEPPMDYIVLKVQV